MSDDKEDYPLIFRQLSDFPGTNVILSKMKEKNYNIKVKLKFKGVDDEENEEDDSEPHFSILDVCKKYEKPVKDIFTVWIEESIKTHSREISKKWFSADDKHFNAFIPKYIWSMNVRDEDEGDKKKGHQFVYAATDKKIYIIWYENEDMEDDNDEDEEKKKEVDLEKEAKKKMKEILSTIENYIKNPFKLFECKITEKSKVKEVETKLDSFLSWNLFHTQFIQDSETLKIYIYG